MGTVSMHVNNTGSFDDRLNQNWTPEWAKSAVWYQIFPERFYNGNPHNDPTLDDIRGAWPHDLSEPWQIHPWTSDWYRLQPYEKVNGKDFWFNVQRRRYGGDIAGIIEKIPYLKELGINAVYLNPVFMAPSSHKYDGATYHHIDPTFGPDPHGDLALISQETPHDPSTWVWTAADTLMLRLIDELHASGIRVIFDGVFNHMGINSWAFQDILKNGQNSLYKDWFDILSWDDPLKKTKFKYKGWFGVKELPELREDENGIVDGPKRYIFEATRRWMNPNADGSPDDGIDGWRLDVAFCVGHPFWKTWRQWVKEINPNAYLTAEVVDPPDVIKPYLLGDEFDAVMNYNFAFICSEYFINETNRITTGEFDRRLAELRSAFDPCVAYVMQNLYDSHDTNRLASHIINRDKYSPREWSAFFEKTKATNPQFNTRKPTPEEYAVQKLMVLFQMTYLGAPMIYYGDETGMWGANDPCCRKPMMWSELDYEPEAVLPDGKPRQHPDSVSVNQDLFEH
ncbi:glycoside hydrolase family 13 protein, partial [candidate division KSB1 bacterium]|nr:glycoside hydrolase family 13 protein [candidate division KSB1 bacterium]